MERIDGFLEFCLYREEEWIPNWNSDNSSIKKNSANWSGGFHNRRNS
jgi:hypothetical protein